MSLASRVVTVIGNTVTLSLDRYGVDPTSQLFLANGNYELALSPSVTDVAGNAVDTSGTGSSGTTGVIDFFKLLCDYNGDRHVDFTDFLALQAAFGTPNTDPAFNPHLDHNANGVIDFTDFLNLQSAFGASVPAVPAVRIIKNVKPVPTRHAVKGLSVAKR